MTYNSSNTSFFQLERFVLNRAATIAGYIELNPGPVCTATDTQGATAKRRNHSISVFHQHVRSLKKKQVGALRVHAPVLEYYDVLSFSETGLNDHVQDSKLELGFSEHTLFRRDGEGLGGGAACAGRSI